ncbi:VirB2 family type IV secretion system major pilin TrwL [Bartonella sp. B30(2025)]
MKYLKTLQSEMINRLIIAVTAVSTFFITHPTYAKDLETAGKALKALQKQLVDIVPIAAAVILLCLAISYAGRFIEKDTFLRWSVGVIIAGSATGLADMLFKPN